MKAGLGFSRVFPRKPLDPGTNYQIKLRDAVLGMALKGTSHFPVAQKPYGDNGQGGTI